MAFNLAATRLALCAVETNTWGTALETLQARFNFQLWGGLLTTLAAVWWVSAIYLRKRAHRVRKVDNPQRLFRELVRAHRLSWAETALVEQLAEARGLEDAATMFVRDDYFTVHDLEGEVAEKAAAVEKLRAKLFATVEVAAVNAEQAAEAVHAPAVTLKA